MPHRNRILDIAADHIKHTRTGRNYDIAMAGEPAGQQFVKAHPAAARQADQIAPLRRIEFGLHCDDDEPPRVEPRSVDISPDSPDELGPG